MHKQSAEEHQQATADVRPGLLKLRTSRISALLDQSALSDAEVLRFVSDALHEAPEETSALLDSLVFQRRQIEIRKILAVRARACSPLRMIEINEDSLRILARGSECVHVSLSLATPPTSARPVELTTHASSVSRAFRSRTTRTTKCSCA
jgi:hypothetical protein